MNYIKLLDNLIEQKQNTIYHRSADRSIVNNYNPAEDFTVLKTYQVTRAFYQARYKDGELI